MILLGTKIKRSQLQNIITIFLCGSSIVTGGLYDAGRDAWICLVFSYLLILPMMWVYSALLDLNEEHSFLGCIRQICGKYAGGVLCFLFGVNVLVIGGMVTRIFAEFIRDVNMTETPITAILAAVIGTSVVMLKKRLYVFARIARFALPFFLVTVIATVLLSLKNMNFDYLKPFFQSGFPTLAGTTLEQFAMPWGELLFLLPMFDSLDKKGNSFSLLWKGSFPALLFLVIISLRNLLILGYSAGVFAFPSYEATSIIAVGEFFNRVEVLVGINMLFTGFIKLSAMGYTAGRSFAAAFGYDDYEVLTAPCLLIIFTLAFLSFSNSVEIGTFYRYLPFMAFPAELLLPIFLLILGKLKRRFGQRKNSARKPGKAKKSFPPKVPEPQETD